MPNDEHPLDLDFLAREVAQARMRRGWSKEEAGRRAGVSSITWKRVEDGKRVQDAKLGLILEAVGLKLFRSGDDEPVEHHGAGSTASESDAVTKLRAIVEKNISDLQAEAERTAGELVATDPERAAQMLRDAAAVAVQLRQSVERTIASGAIGLGVSAPSDEVPDAIAAHEEDEPIAGETGHDEHP